MTSTTLRPGALPALAAQARTAAAGLDPGAAAAVCGQAASGLGGLQSAAVLAGLAPVLVGLLDAVQRRWLALVAHTGAAADRYAALEAAVVRAEGPGDPALLTGGASPGATP